MIDEFGQWKPVDWPGKVKSLEQLKKEWAEEEARLAPGDFGYGRYGGYRATQARATGFFRVEQIDGKWWFVDPEGHLFLSMGVNVMSHAMGTPIAGREHYFAALPPAEFAPPSLPGLYQHVPQVSYYTWNIGRRFGDDWRRKWANLMVRRMEAWGLNTMYPRAPELIEAEPRKPYIITVRDWQLGGSTMGLPDVYSEEFARSADEVAARDCAPRKNEPYLLGYFVGNEPSWPERESELVDIILAGPPTAIQSKAKAFLARGDTPARRKAFVLSAYEKFLEVINRAVRRHDPNHLNLGVRFGRMPGEELVRMAHVFDVYSHNLYRYAPDPEEEQKLYELSGRPVLIGEFHIGAPGRGLSAGLVQACDQKERAAAYSYYVEQAVSAPAMIGVHWFQWMDQPPTGRMDGENYNIGFVDGTDRPHWEFLEGVIATHKRLFAVHSGQEPPTTRRPKPQ